MPRAMTPQNRGGRSAGKGALRDGGARVRKDSGVPDSPRARPLSRRDSAPSATAALKLVATVELFLDGRFAVHVRVDGMALAPILPPDVGPEQANQYNKIASGIADRLDELSQHHGKVSKLPSYMSEVRDIGLKFGGLLFGYRDVFQPNRGGYWGNELDRALGELYHEAKTACGYILISFAAELDSWNKLPWELALWRRGAEELHLGVAEHFAFVRRVHHPGFGRPVSDEPPSKLALCHLSSKRVGPGAATAALKEHQRIEELLEGLIDKNAQLTSAKTNFTGTWRDQSQTPIDIFQFFGHGTLDRRIVWIVEEGDDNTGLQIGARELLNVLKSDQLPWLFLLVACNSFGFVEDILQQTAATSRTVAGIGMLGYWRLLPDHNAQFVRAFYSVLFRYGRLDLAIQGARRALYQLELRNSLSPGTRIPENWFLPVLLLRDASSAGHFQGLTSLPSRQGDRVIVRGHEAPSHGDEFAAERESLKRVLRALRAVRLPVSPVELQERGEELHQDLTGLELGEVRELATHRNEILDILKQDDPANNEGTERVWQEVAEKWRSLERIASVLALEHGISDI
ncbi:MAG: CHAT domain-containing protein [Proteobacteria bacterium]|nr:CHAT domain-containing protein [Pseudomonadota bacterium]